MAQIKSRFDDLQTQHGQPPNSLFGVGLDGRYFVFVRFRDGDWHVQEPVPVTPYSAERFLRALFNLGTKGKPFTALEFAGSRRLESATRPRNDAAPKEGA